MRVANPDPPAGPRRLRRAELPFDTVELANYLLGKLVVHDTPAGRIGGRIVETEAYPPGDPAGHAFVGQTARNRSLFLPRGYAYVYFIYGTWFMLNVSSERRGEGAGVLLRALEPVLGTALMGKLRGTTRAVDLARGPGRLAQALAVTRAQDGLDLCGSSPLWLGAATEAVGAIGTSVRIGISRAVERPWRFYLRGNPHVSGSRRFRA